MRSKHGTTAALLLSLSAVLGLAVGPSNAFNLQGGSMVLAPTAVEDVELDLLPAVQNNGDQKGNTIPTDQKAGFCDGSVRNLNGGDAALLPAVRPGSDKLLNFANGGPNGTTGGATGPGGGPSVPTAAGAPNGLIGLLRTGGDTATNNGPGALNNVNASQSLNFTNQLNNLGITDGTHSAAGAANASLNFTNIGALNFASQMHGAGGGGGAGFGSGGGAGFGTGGGAGLGAAGLATFGGGGGAGTGLRAGGATNASLNFTRNAAPVNLNLAPGALMLNK